jgi:penicillin-binding protein 1A
MTDLLQTAVNAGSGRAAQIGRPVAGKTGTTSSNKDGWFVGFSSGLTSGVWMGRDDNKRVGGLQGGTAPARAFSAFMKPAVADRPVEQFETEVTLPEWQVEPDQEAYGAPDNGVYVDQDGNPVERPEANPDAAPAPDRGDDEGGEMDQDWLDRMTGRNTPPRDAPAPSRPQDRAPPRDAPRELPRPLQESRPNE